MLQQIWGARILDWDCIVTWNQSSGRLGDWRKNTLPDVSIRLSLFSMNQGEA